MTDIDFDELDRAVNSLVNPAVDATSPAPAAEAVAPAPTSPAPSQPDTTTPLAARRSSGRFMDVVHPSSDMRVAVPPRPAVASREGVSITPPAATAAAAPSVPSPVAPTVPAAPATTDMPDPLDFHGFTPGAQETTPTNVTGAPADVDQDIAAIADELSASQSDAPQTPLETPFISDAKVEKRPLGAFSADTSPAPESAETVETTVEPSTPASEPTVTPDPVQPDFSSSHAEEPADTHPMGNDTPLPAELQGDVLSIESSEETAPAAAQTDAEVPTGPTSITQQYTEQASTGDQPAGSIFDTEAYKKPLAHPKKKQSGWLMVLWILLLIIIGAGAGAAVYFYVLPLL